ncbi:hypothetical protein G9A89_020150 [Geosiphon pyriformis]|nr:hypothetical protein G9A89_020150 [Geosiphon pyriformis]
MANSWHPYFDETDVEDWDLLQFHIEWILANEGNPVNLAYDKSSDALTKSLRAIVNSLSDDEKVTKPKSLLADIKASLRLEAWLLARCSLWFLSVRRNSKCLCSSDGLWLDITLNQRKKGNDIDKLWLTIENQMCALQIDRERKNLEILQVITQITSQSQSYASTSNDSALANLKFTATKVNQDQELFGSKKDEIQTDSENNLFSTSEDEYVYSQEILNEGIKLPASNKRGNEIERDDSEHKKARESLKSNLQPENKSSSFESLPSDENNKEHDEDNMEIKFDLTSISTELQREPIVKWEVGHINVTNRFQQYQKDTVKKAEIKGLKYNNIYELLALSSIIVLSSPCPYPSLFTIQEWKEVTEDNPYTVQESSLSPDILSSLNEASFNHFLGMDTYMEGGKSKLSRLVARSFNDLYHNTMNIAPIKLSEEEHCLNFLYPIVRPFFGGEKEYDLVLNRSNAGSKKRPDLSCVVNGDLMESYSMDLKYDGLYRSWPFLTTRLVVDKTMLPLAGVAIHHLVSLEKHVESIAKDFKYRKSYSGNTTPTEQMSFMRKFPDSPQIYQRDKNKVKSARRNDRGLHAYDRITK